MELKIYWTDFSKKELQNIFEYYKKNASIKVAKSLTIGIAKETLKLKKQPKIGQIEELLIDRQNEFRYLVYKNYKIIYWINIPEWFSLLFIGISLAIGIYISTMKIKTE